MFYILIGMLPKGMFINRTPELLYLNKLYSANKPELIILYGRRRIGKTALLREFIQDKNGLYLMADVSENILDHFSRVISKQYSFVKFVTWDDLFEFVKAQSRKRFVLILDEFQYLYQVNKAFPTILQRWWEELVKTKIMIILCGSSISMIKKIAMGYGSALYGRKTAELELKPLSFIDAKKFIPKLSIDDFVAIYSIFGGVPRYLEEMTGNIYKDIKEKILDTRSFMYNEPLNLMFEEFKDFSRYFSILSAVADGAVRFNEICQKSRIPTNKLFKYLMVLERVGLIEKCIPVLGKVKGGNYRIKDNFFQFWFRYVYPNRSMLELGLIDDINNNIKLDLNRYIGKAFENIAKELLIRMNRDKRLPFTFSEIGQWWYKDQEIDLVAVDKKQKNVMLFEVKWKEITKKDVERIFNELEERSKALQITGCKYYYGIIVKKNKDRIKVSGDKYIWELSEFV